MKVSFVARTFPTNVDISSRDPSSTNSSMQWRPPTWLWTFEATMPLVLVPEAHHLLLDARRLVVEDHGDDAHQFAALQFLVLELAEEVATGLPEHLASTGVAVVVGELVDSLE